MEAQFGKFSGEQVKKFIHNKPYSVDLIASHGHTIFHQPSNGFTTQIGSGAHILAASNIPVVTDFRSLDVGLGGQGAPLVPIGDKLLFNTYPYCLNLGGIANISFDKKNKRIAGDICSVNILLNKLAEEKGKLFDRNGLFASKGIIDQPLLKSLNAHAFYKKEFPKSIGREWIDRMIFPILNKANISTEDKLATCCEHIAIQIASMVKQAAIPGELLITGGGAYNQFLVQRIKFHTPKTNSFVFPNKEIISFKEALIFAFLGLKRILGEENALSSVTGASQNSIGGALYGAIKGAN
jgi:anhydro-N-acetylmuramic acid kinase